MRVWTMGKLVGSLFLGAQNFICPDNQKNAKWLLHSLCILCTIFYFIFLNTMNERERERASEHRPRLFRALFAGLMKFMFHHHWNILQAGENSWEQEHHACGCNTMRLRFGIFPLFLLLFVSLLFAANKTHYSHILCVISLNMSGLGTAATCVI